jgi:lipopolysaccharide export system protein LptC
MNKLLRERLQTTAFLSILTLAAGATGWLALNSGLRYFREATKPVVRHDPDYVIEGFSMTRLGETGAVTTQLTGTRLTHFPDDDSAVLEKPRVIAVSEQKLRTQAQAQTAVILRGGEEVVLKQNVQIIRELADAAPSSRLELQTEQLHVFPDTEVMRGDLPVVGKRGTSTISANGMLLDNAARTAQFQGHVKGEIAPRL